MNKILGFILLLAFLQAVRGGMEPDPPPIRYNYYEPVVVHSACSDIEPNPLCD